MSEYLNYTLCEEAEELYKTFCDLADARPKKQVEATRAWRDYIKHRKSCEKCTPLQKYIAKVPTE